MKSLKYYLNILKKILKDFLEIINQSNIFPDLIKFLIICFFCFFEIYLHFPYEKNLIPFDYCNLTDVNYTAILHDDEDGKANVEITEYLTFDIHGWTDSYKEIWRELPEQTIDGVKVTYDVKSVSQILDDGSEIPYIESPKLYWDDEDFTPSSIKKWHHSTGSGIYPDNYESLLMYIPWTYKDKLTFKIVYSLNNAALKYNDCSELYLSMYSGSTIKKLKSFKAQILIPNDIMPTTYYTYTFGTAKYRVPFSESATINPGYYTFSMDLDKSNLKFNHNNQYIEFCLLTYGYDKHIFTKYAPSNYYTYSDVLDECIEENTYYEKQYIKYKGYKLTALMASIAISIFIIKHTKNKISKIKENCTIYKPEIDYEYFREIPSDLDPIFAADLVFMKEPFYDNSDKKEEYAAILLSLARKQYVKIDKIFNDQDWSKKNTLISIEPITEKKIYQDTENSTNYTYKQEEKSILINENTKKELEPLSTSEKLYLNLIYKHCRKQGNKISLKQLQKQIHLDYVYTNIFIEEIETKPALEIGVTKGYFQSSSYDTVKKALISESKINLIIGLILLFIVNIFSYFTSMNLAYGAYTILGITFIWKYIYLIINSYKTVLLSQYGVNEQAKWYGLYNFLNSDTLINEKNINDITLWEKYLIYATAFGISEKVIKALKIHTVKLNTNSSRILNNNCYIHSHHFHSTSRAFGHSFRSSSRGGFSSFSGHGYGGGGRGGGGGGGGH